MAFTPNQPFPKGQGDVIRSSDWNDLVNEAIQLDGSKVSRSGDAITGSLTISGSLGVGMTTAPGTSLEVHGHLTLEASASPNLYTGTGGAELNRYLQLLNTPGLSSASGLKVGGVLVSDSYAFANPGKNDLVIKGRTAIGTPTPQAPLHILGGNGDVNNTEGDLKIGNDTLRLKIGVALDGSGAGDARIRAQGGTQRLLLGAHTADVLVLDLNGVNIGPNITGLSNLLLPKTAGGSAIFTNRTLFNENAFQPNNLKLSMGDSSFIIPSPGQPPPPPLTYEFCIGNTFASFSFVKRLSVTQDGVTVSGNLTVTGSKSGYVVDHFINSVGDTLELGDVVVIGAKMGEHAYGVDNNIPIPEVDLTTNAYDTRVCGIVDKVVIASETPHVEVQVPVPPEALEGQDAPQGRRERQAEPLTMTVQDRERLQPLTAAVETSDVTKVAHGQMGKMVTLGAFAHCKVDADVAPIAVGDLLTTSPTRGHAQKVLEPGKAVGAIIGKALGALDRGKGKIPVLVMLQ